MKKCNFLVIATLAALVGRADGAVIFDTLSPFGVAGENIGNAGSSNLRHAIGFETSGVVNLTSITFNLSFSTGGFGDFIVEIYEDNDQAFHAPGSLLTSFSFSMPDPVALFESELFEVVVPSGVVLQANRIYWIAPTTSVVGEYAFWWYSTSGDPHLRAAKGYLSPPWPPDWFSSCGATNNCSSLATRVEGTVVPEPSTGLLALGGLIAVALLPRLRRNLKG